MLSLYPTNKPILYRIKIYQYNMKTLLLVIFSFCLVATTSAQVSRTTSQTVSAATAITVNLDLDASDIEIVETKGSRIVIESSITLHQMNNTRLLDFVIKSGRYELDSNFDNTTRTLTIERKKNRDVLVIKGEECKETVKYKILIPTSVKFVNQNGSTASIN